MHNHTK